MSGSRDGIHNVLLSTDGQCWHAIIGEPPRRGLHVIGTCPGAALVTLALLMQQSKWTPDPGCTTSGTDNE